MAKKPPYIREYTDRHGVHRIYFRRRGSESWPLRQPLRSPEFWEDYEAAKKGEVSSELIDELVMDNWPRGEKIANKDIKLRTFISQEEGRAQLVSHVYDITYGVVREGEDALVCIDPGSEPPSASVRPKHPTISPLARDGRYSLFCSSDP